jgi:HEAT repeat protein
MQSLRPVSEKNRNLKEGSMQQEMSSTVKSLVSALSSFNDFSRVEARKALESMGSQAVPYLIEALKHPDYLRRWEAAKALGEIKDPKAATALVQALEDEKFDVRWLAARALIEMNVKGLRPLFKALIERADSVLLRQGAHHVLHDLAKGELRTHLVPVLIDLENPDSAHLPTEASYALESLEKAGIL